MEQPPVKTAKQLEKDAKKLAKLEKFKQKQDQKQNAPKEEVCTYLFVYLGNKILSIGLPKFI